MLNSLSKYFAVLTILIGSICSGFADNRPPLRVMSFNVRTSKAHDGTNSWNDRQDYFFHVIDQFSPSLIGFQEVMADQYDAIVGHMSDYSFAGVAREDGKRKGEWSLLGFRKDRFEKLDSGTFWLSEHPEEIGSRSWDAALPRICTWAKLRDKTVGREFLYANTHFDHKGQIAREKSAQLILTRLKDLAKGAPVVLTGDFNVTEDSKPYALIAGHDRNTSGSLVDSYREMHPLRKPDEASFNGFKPVVNGSRIDFIFHSAQLKATAATIERQRSPEGKFASDHYAVTAVLAWGGETR
jgi:endonuclease/exonuclease/phosphatase family metal-dependent hydrolase